MVDLLHSRLGHRYSATVQVLLEPLVELIESAQLQLGHALLLASAGIVCPDLVGGRHCDR